MEAVEESVSRPDVTPPGRETVGPLPDALVVRALLGAGCSHQRAADLLHTSRRTVGRLAETDLTPAWRAPQLLEAARTSLEDTASRGSTAEERAAAAAWLTTAARDEHQVEGVVATETDMRRLQPAAATPPVSAPGARKARVHARRPSRTGAHHNGAHRNRAATLTAVLPDPPSPASLDHVDALRRQQQRILHRTELLNYVLTVEKRSGAPLTMGDALAELLADIAEAARTIGTILHPVTSRRG
jgi:hypothetical protein